MTMQIQEKESSVFTTCLEKLIEFKHKSTYGWSKSREPVMDVNAQLENARARVLRLQLRGF